MSPTATVSLLILLLTILTCECFDGKIADYVGKNPRSECGLERGGPLLQQVTGPYESIKSLYYKQSSTSLLFVDPKNGNINFYYYKTGRTESIHIKELEDTELVGTVPGKNGNKQLVIITTNALYYIHLGDDNTKPYTLTKLQTVLKHDDESIITGLLSSDGKLWLGVAIANNSSRGKLIKVDVEKRQVEQVEEKNQSYTDLAWNKDNTVLYVMDRQSDVIRSYKYDAGSGSISDAKVVFNMAENSGDKITGHIASFTVDTDECLWIGLHGEGAVIQYDPKTEHIRSIVAIPARSIVSVSFGGPNIANLFIGTTTDKQFVCGTTKLVDNRMKLSVAGSIFAISGLGATGQTDAEYVLPDEYVELVPRKAPNTIIS